MDKIISDKQRGVEVGMDDAGKKKEGSSFGEISD